MSVPLVINGVTYNYPELNDSPPLVEWGVTATDWATAVTQGMLQKAGGTFTLTANVNFGATYGLLTAFLSSRVTPVAATGLVRLDNANWMAWRNIGDTADLKLAVNASNQLTFDGNVLETGSGGDVTGPVSATDNAIVRFDGVTGKLVQNSLATVSDAGTIFSDSLTASRAVVTDGSKNLISSVTTATEITYLSGVTSAIQPQITNSTFPAGTKLPFYQAAAPTGWTLDSSVNDRFIRISSSAGGTTSGSFSNLSHAHSHAHTHGDGDLYAQISINAGFDGIEVNHVTVASWTPDEADDIGGSVTPSGSSTTGVNVVGDTGAASVTNTDAETISHGSAQHAYADFIICTKD